MKGIVLRPEHIDWAFISTWLYRIVIFASVMALLYLKSIFVTTDQVVSALEPYKPVPAQIQQLEILSKTSRDYMQELVDWRSKKDEIDVKLIVLMEGIQHMLDRQQIVQDRQQNLIDLIGQQRNNK